MHFPDVPVQARVPAEGRVTLLALIWGLTGVHGYYMVFQLRRVLIRLPADMAQIILFILAAMDILHVDVQRRVAFERLIAQLTFKLDFLKMLPIYVISETCFVDKLLTAFVAHETELAFGDVPSGYPKMLSECGN